MLTTCCVCALHTRRASRKDFSCCRKSTPSWATKTGAADTRLPLSRAPWHHRRPRRPAGQLQLHARAIRHQAWLLCTSGRRKLYDATGATGEEDGELQGFDGLVDYFRAMFGIKEDDIDDFAVRCAQLAHVQWRLPSRRDSREGFKRYAGWVWGETRVRLILRRILHPSPPQQGSESPLHNPP